MNCVDSIWRAAASEDNSVPMLTAGARGLDGSAQCAPSMMTVIRSGNTCFSTIVLASIRVELYQENSPDGFSVGASSWA